MNYWAVLACIQLIPQVGMDRVKCVWTSQTVYCYFWLHIRTWEWIHLMTKLVTEYWTCRRCNTWHHMITTTALFTGQCLEKQEVLNLNMSKKYRFFSEPYNSRELYMYNCHLGHVYKNYPLLLRLISEALTTIQWITNCAKSWIHEWI